MTTLALALLALAALIFIVGPVAMHLYERSQGMTPPAETQAQMDAREARVIADFDNLDATARRIHAQMVSDGLAGWDGIERRTHRAMRKGVA